mmetsp:Transcript_4912/g.11246  ORF Transcript_4912/g.11246 Transcript_4912/m.11246 type:complete len:1423 (+) Transcript_4912:56-4324(+)
MARKAKKRTEAPPPADDGDVTEEESVHDDDDAQMDTEGDDDDEDEDPAVEETKKSETSDKDSKKKDKKTNEEKAEAAMIPFMDTFYHLSSEDSTSDRAIAARDLIHHCFLTKQGVNHKDAAYALTRLMNGLCTGRAASRQGFASCLSSFLRVAHSSSLNKSDVSAMEEILKEDDCAKELKEDMKDAHPAVIVRQKLLSTTQFLAAPVNSNEKGQNKKTSGGKVKGIEERDHAFGRLFGVLAVVRSGLLRSKDFPSEVVEGYTKDLIELFHYKKWMKEPSAHAVIELLSSLDTESNLDLIEKITNDVITPTFFLSKGNDRVKWLQTLTPEQIAVALHLQMLQTDAIKYAYPLDTPVVTAESVPTLSAALGSTSSVVHPRCHVVWNSLWMYLTEEVKTQGHRQLRANEEFPLIVEKIIQHVVLDILLGKGEESAKPTNERRSLALQIVSALSGSSELKMDLPMSLIGSILSPEVVTLVFVNVLCASGGVGKKSGVEHNLKPLTSQVLVDLINHCCEDVNVDRRMAFAKAFLLTDPRFDTKTKTQTVSSLLMIENGAEMSEEFESKRVTLWQNYLTFLEEEIVSATSLHNATVYIELMYKLAKRDLTEAPANEARRVVRFFMSGAFFDCSDLSDPSVPKKSSSKKKKKDKAKATATSPPQELSSGLRIKEILKANGMASISHPARAIMSARFYSLLSEFISAINSQNRGGNTNKTFYGKGSRPESVFRALSEISGISSLLETSGAKKFPRPSPSVDADEDSDSEDPVEASRKSMLRVQKIANEALVKECGGSGDADTLRSKAVFATSCASLMISLDLQLNSCGNPDADGGEEDEDDDNVEAVHEYISDLADCVDGFSQVIEDESSFKKKDDEENPLAMMAGLLVNILSSPVGGEDSGKTNPIQASASKLARETVKLAWSGIISVITSLNEKNASLKTLVDEDVMSILIESVCGENSIEDQEKGEDDESIEESVTSEDGLGDSAVFVDATDAGMDLEEVKDNNSDDSKESDDESGQDGTDKDGDEDVELDPIKLENLLLEDSDAEMSDNGVHGVLEHHAGADKALAALIKLRQEARKASQTERERIELCNRLRCASLLDSLFSLSVSKSGWLPIEAVLGSIVPILRSRKAIAKSIQASSSANAKKSLNEKNALLDRLSLLMKDKISKFRCSEGSSSQEVALKASSDIYEEMKQSLNVSHCSCCSVALITAVKCIPNAEGSDEIKDIYSTAIDEWSSRKTTKIHSCVFDDLIQRMPSQASLILVEPLMTAAAGAHSPFLKCESIKLLSAIYKHDASNSEEVMSKDAKSAVTKCCSKVAETLKDALGDSSLKKAKHRDEVLSAIKNVVNYVKAQDEGILTESELCSLQETLKAVGGNCKSAGMKQLCVQVSDTISRLPRRSEVEEQKPKRSKTPKTPKSSKKPKKSKK